MEQIKDLIKKSDLRFYLFNKNLFLILFIMQFVFLAISNLFFIKYNVDADSAILFDHAIEMYNEKTFFIDGWQNTTTLEFDSALFLAIFIFAITKNIYISFGIANILICLIYVWAINIFTENIHLNKIYTYIILILMFIPYRIGQLDYFNMLFFVGGQYGMKVLIPLMLLALITSSGKENKKNYYLFEGIYYLFLLLVSISSGIYVFICGVFPVLLCETFYNIKEGQRTSKIRIFSISIFIALLGIFFSKMLVSDTKSFEIILTDIYKFKDNFFNCLLGIFEIFKAIPYGTTNVMSIAGILFVGRVVFVCLVLYAVVFYLNRIKYNIKSVNIILGICIWNIFILILTYTTYGSKTFEYRYHLMWIIPAIILFVLRLKEILRISRKDIAIIISLCLLGLIGIIDLQSCYTLAKNYNNYNSLKILTEKVAELNPGGTVFSLGNEFHEIQDNHILRLIGQDNEYLFIKSNSNEIRLFNNYKKFLDNATYTEKNVVLATAKEMEKLPQYIKNQYQLRDKQYIYNIYIADNNKFDYISGFTGNDISRDFPYSPGYACYSSTINENGELETTGNEGYVLVSPSLQVVEDGVYDIKLNYTYEGDMSGFIGNFKLFSDNFLVCSKNIIAENDNVILQNVKLSETDDNVQIKIFNNKDVKMILKSIEIYYKYN